MKTRSFLGIGTSVPAILLASYLFSGTANAEFAVMTDPQGGDAVAAATAKAGIKSRGGMPLGAALKQLAPQGWKGYAAKGMDTNFTVELEPGMGWYDTLQAMATRYNLHIKADPNDKVVFVSEGAGGMRDLDAERKKIEAAVIQNEQQATRKEMMEGGTDFVVKSGQRLSEALTVFLKKGDWRLEWEVGTDFVIKQGFSVTGKSLRDVLDASLTPFGIHAVLYTVNRVVVVRSNTVNTTGQ